MPCPAWNRVGPSSCSEQLNVNSVLTGIVSLVNLHQLIFCLCVNPKQKPLPLVRRCLFHPLTGKTPCISTPRCPGAVNNLLNYKCSHAGSVYYCFLLVWSWFPWRLPPPPPCPYSTPQGPYCSSTWRPVLETQDHSDVQQLQWVLWWVVLRDAWLASKHHPLDKEKQPDGKIY